MGTKTAVLGGYTVEVPQSDALHCQAEEKSRYISCTHFSMEGIQKRLFKTLEHFSKHTLKNPFKYMFTFDTYKPNS